MAKAAKEKKEGGGAGGLIAGFAVVTLLAAAVGGGFGFYVYGNFGGAEGQKPQAEAQKPEDKTPTIPSNTRLVDLAPIIVNLAEPRDVWMRVEASLLVEGSWEGVDVLSRHVSEDIAAYLKTASLAQFEGASGFQNLREDLRDRARVRDSERVKDLIIHGIVVE